MERRHGGALDTEGRAKTRAHPVLRGARESRRRVHRRRSLRARRKGNPHPVAACRFHGDDVGGHLRSDRIEQGSALAPVVAPHPPDVPVECVGRHELGERHLIQQRGLHGSGDARTGEGAAERGGGEEIAETKTGEERLREGPEVEHQISRVTLLQGSGGRRLAAELRVVVVFDDRNLLPGGEPEKARAALRRERHRRRVLDGGRGVHAREAPALLDADEVLDPHPLPVYRDSHELGAGGTKREKGTEVAGVLHRDAVPAVDQDPRDKIERLLGSGDEEEFVRLAGDPAPDQAPGERLAQRRPAEQVEIVGVAREFAERALIGAFEFRERQGGGIDAARTQVDPDRVRYGRKRRNAVVPRAAREQCGPGHRRDGRRRRFGRTGFGSGPADEGSSPHLGVEEPDGAEGLVGAVHRVPRKAEGAGQVAGGWEALASRQAARSDQIAETRRELVVERLGAAGVRTEGEIEHTEIMVDPIWTVKIQFYPK